MVAYGCYLTKLTCFYFKFVILTPNYLSRFGESRFKTSKG